MRLLAVFVDVINMGISLKLQINTYYEMKFKELNFVFIVFAVKKKIVMFVDVFYHLAENITLNGYNLSRENIGFFDNFCFFKNMKLSVK